jgi:GntR family transcriptional regulator/MocR family aminotransferase
VLDIRLQRGQNSSPLHQQLVDQIRFQIVKGEVPPGARLPSTRNFARELGVSRGTVVQAYEELCSMGVCEGQVGRGTSVGKSNGRALRSAPCPMLKKQNRILAAPNEAIAPDPREVSLLPSLADTEHLPITELRRAFDRVLRFAGPLKSFSECAGDPVLRQAICEKVLPERGISADVSEVMIVPGTQYGAMLVALALSGLRKRIHFGSPGYLDFARNFGRFGFEMVPHRLDRQGLDLSDQTLGADDILHVMPEHHFPQCVTLSDVRRRAIERMATERNLLILEDDYDSEYYYDHRPKTAMKAGKASRSIIYFGTFSMTLFNNLRLGYVVAEPEMLAELAALHWSISRGTSGLVQRWVAELIKENVIARHVQRMRSVYRQKRDRVAEVLRHEFPEWRFEAPSGGLQFCIDVGSAQQVQTILKACGRLRLKISSLDNYVPNSENKEQCLLVIGFGAAPVSQISDALRKLKRSLSLQTPFKFMPHGKDWDRDLVCQSRPNERP